MKSKKVLGMALAVAMSVTAGVFGTMAYLTSTPEKVVNTFTVGNVAITLDETDVDVLGVKDGETRVTKNTYKLIPGHIYVKDPTVHIAAGSENCYVRMFVTISRADKLSALYDDQWTPDKWAITAGDGWEYYADGFSVDDAEKTATYEFRCNDIQEAGTDMDALFENFTVDGSLTGEQVATLEDMEITVTAEAIQADGFDNAAAAFSALDASKKAE